MKYAWLFVFLILVVPAQAQEAMSLVWADEFDYEGLPDSGKWDYDYGTGCPRVCGWGNNELQFYTRERLENARVEDGKLIIEARKEAWKGTDYTSARLVTRGKQAWQYGRIEVRAKLPSGTGTWPAIWMLPEDNAYGGWPRSGEIDIMEHVGYEPAMIYGTVHTGAFNHIQGTQRGDTLEVPGCELAYHVYAIEWDADRITFFVDDVQYNEFPNEGTGPDAWPFDQPFYLVLNLAVGGNWGGRQGVDTDIWPQTMEVDYVRVYQAE